MHWKRLLILLLVAVAMSQGTQPQPAAAASDAPVLAFYYPWYNKSDFTRSTMFDIPAAPYDSDSRAAFERHVAEASGAGITGFISSWWGQGNRTDRNFATLLDVCKATGFTATIYFETGAPGLDNVQGVINALRYVMSTYGSHPNFARVGGKPAIFFWSPASAGPASTWANIRSQVDPRGEWHWNVETDRPENWLDVFDGIHLFSAASWTADATATYKNLKSKVEATAGRTGKPKLWAAGVAPGWDNSRQGSPTTVIVNREQGGYYARRWEAALASNPSAITITSWNEWGEGTAIEPGANAGTLYLDITRKYAGMYRQTASSFTALSGVGFKFGFNALADQIPYLVGQPLENEHYAANGDSLQRTTNGLMVWRKADNWTAFTDGSNTWINGPFGVQQRTNEARFPWEKAG